MKATILVEKVGKRFRASTSQPVPMETEGKSREEALKHLLELAEKRIANGQLLEVTLPGLPEANPWRAFAGIWKGHPDFDAFLKNIAEYRRTVKRSSST